MDRATNQTSKHDSEAASRLREWLQIEAEMESRFLTRHPITPEELPTVRSEIRETAERIFGNWRSLESIVLRHEAIIQKRWTNKSTAKRRALLLTTWPNMARDHRPDIALESKSRKWSEMKKQATLLLQGAHLNEYEGSQREALLMPYINLHDLTKSEPLLLMINARARQSPHAFSQQDLQLSTHCIWLTKWCNLEGYFMVFDRQQPDGQQSDAEAYGELREGQWKTSVPYKGADSRLANGKLHPGDGLWVLEIQDRIYKFLHDVVTRILHDIPAGDLTGPKYSIQPQPPMPTANSREDGVVSLATTNLEAIYSSPRQMDLHRLQLLVTAKANEEEDKVWALREDPGRFSEELEDFIAHQPEYVPDLLDEQHPSTRIIGYGKPLGSDTRSLKEELLDTFLTSSFAYVEFWADLQQDITDLVKLQKQHFDSNTINPGDPLPEPFATALCKFQYELCVRIELQLPVMRKAACSSPPLRPYIRRASPDTLEQFMADTDRRPPRHIADFIHILFQLFQKAALWRTGHIAGVQSLMEQYDMFINTVPNAEEAVSSFVAEKVSNLALLSECLRQIHLFQPWAATAYKMMQTPRMHETVMLQHNKRWDERLPPAGFKWSAQVRSMAATIAKSPYPVHKTRTAKSVESMQKAEKLLDRMWDAILVDMEQQKAVKPHFRNVLFSQGRQLQRTPDWVEPVRPSKKTPLQVAPSEVMIQSFGGLHVDENNNAQDFPAEKSKIKTRGVANPQIPAPAQDREAENEDESPAHTIQVDRRALRVFRMLFHTPSSTSQPGEIPWKDFLHAMRSAGFGMEKLYGSVWQFTLHGNDEGNTAAGTRGILFHEPHPHSKIPFWAARRHGRRLASTYGWSGETFVAK